MAIEQLYTLQVACELIPMPSIGSLYTFLYNNKEQFTARYRNTRWYSSRLLSESEILKIREMTIHGVKDSRYHLHGHGRPCANAHNPIARIIAMATR
jgi:hypothetical protein